MVSFDFNEAGQEYVIREGRNSLSRGKDADISLFFDDYVSTPHAVIVCHPDGECAIQDQMSSGGTFINGQKVPIGGVSPLRNGDILRCGRSNFKVFLLSQADLADLVPSKRDKAAKR
jgi:pSer/pThr/pTyr-binding forkhead associated (FHA) protein